MFAKILSQCGQKVTDKKSQSLKAIGEVSYIMGLSSETPRVPPGIRWGIYHFGLPEG